MWINSLVVGMLSCLFFSIAVFTICFTLEDKDVSHNVSTKYSSCVETHLLCDKDFIDMGLWETFS